MLLFVFMACVLPICVYSVCSLLSSDRNITLGVVIFMVYWIQYGVNFFLYAIINVNYRIAYKQFIELLVNKVLCIMRTGYCRPGHGLQRSKDDMDHHPPSPSTLAVLPLSSRTTSLALVSLETSTYKEGNQESFFPIPTEHNNCPYPLPCLLRLKAFHSMPPGRADMDYRAFFVHSWPAWRRESQSSGSSVITFDSTVQHDSDISTTIISTTTTTTNTTLTSITTSTKSTTQDTNASNVPPSFITTTTTTTSSTTSITNAKISTTIITPTFTTTTPLTTTIITTKLPTTITTFKTDKACGDFATTAL
ncbi:hypothetical protein E2C01_097322 [Portunus trituberculatus]|uniref:G-protein coupled receptors family 2 profile 2 domain-containing protein n=1 Tax=Portunus trituberculatus TaxID=210409 RepID=A0A5B7K4B7_PORTR|nr:hypothetical protein [Portunus trituberculatus]